MNFGSLQSPRCCTGIEILGNEEERLETLNQNRHDQYDLPALPEPVSRRVFVGSLVAAGAFAPMLRSSAEATGNVNVAATEVRKGESQNSNGDTRMTNAIIEEKIRRARLSGPAIVTANATVVAEVDAQGHLQVLSKGTNEWVCCPGNENIIGDVPMALDPMGMQWFMDLVAHKPKPTNTAPQPDIHALRRISTQLHSVGSISAATGGQSARSAKKGFPDTGR